MAMSDDGMDLLLGGAPAAKFPEVGTVVKGRVIGQKMQQSRDMATGELKTWDNGAPVYEIVFTLATDERDASIENDDGTRRLFARGQMLRAIGDALRKARWSAPLAGGTLAVKYVRDGEATRRGFSPPKIFAAIYTPPEAADEFDAMAGVHEEHYSEEPF
jgi:hypothetical protein